MADTELEDAPWAKKPESKDSGKTESLPDAPWAGKAAPGVAEDVAKTALPSVVRGSLAALTAPRGLSDLAGNTVNYLANRFAPQGVADVANKFHNWNSGVGDNAFPSYDELKTGTEKLTGPLYEAKTGVGKGVQTGLEVAPSMLAGGEGVLPAIGRSAGAGTLSGLLGSGADYLKSKFPDHIPDWVPNVARAGGAAVGGAVTPRAVTPLPMADEQLATVNALRASNPELVQASSAGQLTNSPRVMGLEARSPRMDNVPHNQEQAYTQGVMRQIGAPGEMFNDAGLATARGQGDTIRTLQDAHNMTPAEFALLNRDVNAMGRPGSDLFRRVGPSEPFQRAQDSISQGPMGPAGPTPLNMTGQRYGALKQIIQNEGEAAPTTHEQAAIFAARDRMKQAFQNSMPPDEAERLRQLDQQYSNYKSVEGVKPKAGGETITPDQVASRAPRGSEMKTHADQASTVMTKHPEPSSEPSAGTKALSGVLGGLFGGGAGAAGAPGGAVDLGMLGVIAGKDILPPVVEAAKNAAGRVVANPAVQPYLKNQQWRPQGLVTDAPNREALIKALMATPATANQ